MLARLLFARDGKLSFKFNLKAAFLIKYVQILFEMFIKVQTSIVIAHIAQ